MGRAFTIMFIDNFSKRNSSQYVLYKFTSCWQEYVVDSR